MVANKLLENILQALGGNGDAFNMSSAYLALSTTAPNKDGTNVTSTIAENGNGYGIFKWNDERSY